MRNLLPFAFLFVALAMAAVPASAAPAPNAAPPRVWDGYAKKWVTLSDLLDSLSREQVVFVGEMHDSTATHEMELTILDGLLARRKTVTLALEMFERDVQTVLDDYLAGRIDAAAFSEKSRPWPNYPTDYKPLVDHARDKGAFVVASNVPRGVAQLVAKNGVATLDQMPANHRWWYARHTTAPRDAYWDHFTETMKKHVGEAELERYYAAQCLKDDTMAESIADWLERKGDDAGIVLHVNGAFHSEDNLGVYTKTRERLPKARIATVRIVPVADLGAVDVEKWGKAADWVVFVTAP